MLDYIKYILDKVSFDPHLFEKELRKNTKDLIKEDLLELKRWCYENFGNEHNTILDRFF
jgi:hypothetical protein